MPARQRPTTARNTSACVQLTGANANAALKAAPSSEATATIRLAENRSASPDVAKINVPTMNPNCTALVSCPSCALVSDHARTRSSAALFGLNQSDVPNSCAMTMSATARRSVTPRLTPTPPS